MPEHLHSSLEILRRNPLLWAPAAGANLARLLLDRGAARFTSRIHEWATTQTFESVLEGRYTMADPSPLAAIKSQLLGAPVLLLQYGLTVAAYLSALLLTAALTRMIWRGQQPDFEAAGLFLRARRSDVLRLTLRALAVGAAGAVVLAMQLLPAWGMPLYFRMNPSLTIAMAVTVLSSLACWFLMPEALGTISDQEAEPVSALCLRRARQVAVLLAPAVLLGQFLLVQLAGTLGLHARAELRVLALAVAILSSLPLAYGMTLLARLALGDEPRLAILPDEAAGAAQDAEIE